MKKIIRLFSVILLILMITASFPACSGTDAVSNDTTDAVTNTDNAVVDNDTSTASVNSVPLDNFSIVYADGYSAKAQILKDAILSSTGYDLAIQSADDPESEYEIIIGNVEREVNKEFYEYPVKNTAIYRVLVSGKKIALLATGELTGNLVIDAFKDTFFSSKQTALRLTDGNVIEGDVYGERSIMINQRAKETDIRIGCNNIYLHQWAENEKYSVRKPILLESFVLMDADVLLIQECGHDKSKSPSGTTWHDEIDADMEKLGYSLVPGQKHKLIPNYTPIWYRADKLELVDHKFYTYDSVKHMPDDYLSWSKSYTRAIFKDKTTGEQFACISTHFTWASENFTPSPNELRVSDAKEVVTEIKALKTQYGEDFPIFLAGDLNCTPGSDPYNEVAKVMKSVRLTGGIKKNNVGFSTAHTLGKAPASGGAVIDHTFMSGKGYKAVQYQHVNNSWALNSTDHIPLLLDVDFSAE